MIKQLDTTKLLEAIDVISNILDIDNHLIVCSIFQDGSGYFINTIDHKEVKINGRYLSFFSIDNPVEGLTLIELIEMILNDRL